MASSEGRVDRDDELRDLELRRCRAALLHALSEHDRSRKLKVATKKVVVAAYKRWDGDIILAEVLM